MTGQERTMAERRDEVFNARAALHEAIEMLQRAERFRAVVPLRERANEVAKVALRINGVINWFEDAVHAAACADHEAEVARLRTQLVRAQAMLMSASKALDEAYPDEPDEARVMQRDLRAYATTLDVGALSEEGRQFIADFEEQARAALSGDTLRSSGEEEANG